MRTFESVKFDMGDFKDDYKDSRLVTWNWIIKDEIAYN